MSAYGLLHDWPRRSVPVGATAIAAPASLFLNWQMQILIFAVALFLLLSFVRSLLKTTKHRLFGRTTPPAYQMASRAEHLCGLTGHVSAAIYSTQASGRVLVDGQDWAARHQEPQRSIELGRAIVVTGSDGIVLIVEEV